MFVVNAPENMPCAINNIFPHQHRTPDLFPKGDISGKFGSLVAPFEELNVPELPMYGQFSMLGLTMREVSTNVSLF